MVVPSLSSCAISFRGRFQREQAETQIPGILSFLRDRILGRKRHFASRWPPSVSLIAPLTAVGTSLTLDNDFAPKDCDISNGRQILKALRQGDSNSWRAVLDRALGPFVDANFHLFPELTHCINICAYGVPVLIDDILHLRVNRLAMRQKSKHKTPCGTKTFRPCD